MHANNSSIVLTGYYTPFLFLNENHILNISFYI